MGDLGTLRPGDLAAIKKHVMGTRYSYQTVLVKKVTATQVVVEDEKKRESRFRVRDGAEIGGIKERWGSNPTLVPHTSEVVEQIERERLMREIYATAGDEGKLQRLPTGALRNLAAVLAHWKPTEEEGQDER